MTNKCDAQSVVRRLHQVGYSLEQTDQTPKLTQLMKDSITLIEQMRADVKSLAEALKVLVDCGGIGPEQMFHDARAALARIQGEAG